MKLLSPFTMLAVSLTACIELSAATEEPTAQTTTRAIQADQIVVAELFTSQGCSSCPPAERLFSKLADRDKVLTLEWHVDYWDDLVHGGSRWKDVYSSNKFTQRQRSYNRFLRGKSSSYTPQAVINGRLEGVGSRPGEVSNMLKNAPNLSIAVKIENDTVKVASSNQVAEILFVRLLEKHETNIKGGENKGRKLAGKNIVLDTEVLGQTGAKAAEFKLPSVGTGETCAVLVQTLDGDVGPILGAAKCT